MEQFREDYPGIIPDTVKYSNYFHDPSTEYGIKGGWNYHIQKNLLTLAQYNAQGDYLSVYMSDYDPKKITAQFEKYRKAYEQLVKDYQGKYGKCKNVIVSNPEFIDPKVKSTTYDIQIHTWEHGQEIIIAKFYFSGDTPPSERDEFIANSEGPSYHYNISIEHRKKPNIATLIVPLPSKVRAFQLGMRTDQFAQHYPHLFPNGILLRGAFTKEGTWNGLDGKWYFKFEDGKLESFSFSHYISDFKDLTEENFDKCLAATRKIIDDCSSHGKPKTTEGTLKFRDPGKDRHWGYDVIKAVWKDETEVIFDFFGGKGTYFFVVKFQR